jgi:hypothetical protein
MTGGESVFITGVSGRFLPFHRQPANALLSKDNCVSLVPIVPPKPSLRNGTENGTIQFDGRIRLLGVVSEEWPVS